MKFSIIVPVYNRPKEVGELLESLTKQDYSEAFEVLIIEDGSEVASKEIVKKYQNKLDINYFFKQNSGAGASRNFGMLKASGTYFIILDSDVIVPKHYLSAVKKALESNFTDAFGGADAAHASFTTLQKAINYSMTSVFTTGGIRGKKKSVGKFQPRSFNMGLSKTAFKLTQGFSDMKNGEDIDFTFRLWKSGFETQFIEKAFVYHKRRTSIKQFYKQTYGFGTARPILNRKHPKTAKITYWFPSVFITGLWGGILCAFFGNLSLLSCYFLYFLGLVIDATIKNGVKVGVLSILTTCTQFLGYGLGFLKSQFFYQHSNRL